MADLREQLQATLGATYAIDRELGGGGMSRVFVARDTTLDRLIVIKLLPEDAAATVSAERFKREIVVAAKLQHPHIVPLLSAGEVQGLPFYTMPFVEGESLRDRLSREGELPIDEAVQILKEVVRALAYAHGHGIVHRDIKPDNVMISGGASMVTDFGVAKAVSVAAAATTSTSLTQLGVALGTPAYMSPEQASGQGAIDHRADLYALGCMAYELLTGQPPFTGRNAQSLLAAQVIEQPEPIQKRRASVPPALAAIVMHCLEKRPADRPKSATEVLRALESVVVTPPTTNAYTATTARVAEPRAPIAARLRDPRTIALLAISAFVIAMGARSVVGGTNRVGTTDRVFSMLSFIDGTDPLYERGFSLSPDESQVVFVARSPDSATSTLWVRPLSTHTATPLVGTSNALYPFWSPDGKRIGYFANGQLRIHRLNGSEDRALCPARNGEGGSWGSRNVIVYAPEVRGTIHAVNADGGECRSVTKLEAGVLDHRRPTFLPDGQHFIFGSGSAVRMWIGNVETQEQSPLLKGAPYGDYVDPGYLLFASVAPGKLFVQRLNLDSRRLESEATPIVDELGYSPSARPLFSAGRSTLVTVIQRTSKRSLVRLSRDGGAVKEHIFDDRLGHVRGIEVSRDGSKIAVAGRGLWLYDVDRDATAMLLMGGDTGGVAIGGIRWLPLDTALAYTRTAGSDLGIRVYNFRTGTDRVLISSPTRAAFAYDWSADGRTMLYGTASAMGLEQVEYLLDVTSGKSERILADRPTTSAMTLSAGDARWLAFASTETGRSEIYIMSLRKRAPIRVSRTGGTRPVWRGRELFYRVPNAGLAAVTIELGDQPRIGNPRIVVPDASYAVFNPSWDGRTFWALEFETKRALALIQNWPSLLR